MTRKFHDAIVKCEVQNSVGKSEDSETLDISCKYQWKGEEEEEEELPAVRLTLYLYVYPLFPPPFRCT